MKIEAEFFWVPSEFGGHRSTPWVGMRLEAQTQHMSTGNSQDLVCEELSEFDPSTNIGTGTFRFYSKPTQDIGEGTILHLRNGPRLLALARITP